jgi:hypothetical protein
MFELSLLQTEKYVMLAVIAVLELHPPTARVASLAWHLTQQHPHVVGTSYI